MPFEALAKKGKPARKDSQFQISEAKGSRTACIKRPPRFTGRTFLTAPTATGGFRSLVSSNGAQHFSDQSHRRIGCSFLARLFGVRPSLRAFGRDFEQRPGAIRQD
jgi:hypothetical protein